MYIQQLMREKAPRRTSLQYLQNAGRAEEPARKPKNPAPDNSRRQQGCCCYDFTERSSIIKILGRSDTPGVTRQEPDVLFDPL